MLSLVSDPNEVGHVTGVRMPALDARRRDMFLGAKSPLGVKMVVDRPCTLLVCFHDATALAGVSSVKKASGLFMRQSSAEASKLELPKWVEEMGLKRTSTKVRRNGRNLKGVKRSGSCSSRKGTRE